MEKGIIIFTFDDVLSLTSYDLYEYLLANIKYYDHILDLLTFRSKSDIYSRAEPGLVSSLINYKTVQKVISDESLLNYVNLLYISLFINYYSTENCVEGELTKIANKVLLNPIFRETNGIQKIVILYKYRTDKEKEIKYKFIKEKFKHDKLEIISVPLASPYHTIIESKYSNWSLLVTDDIDCVEHLSKNNIDHKEFLLPKYGYNKASPELVELIKQKSGTLSYYEIEN